jgi:hypothetical protein
MQTRKAKGPSKAYVEKTRESVCNGVYGSRRRGGETHV